MSRQACHLVSVLAEHMGARLEPLAMAFLPALFKVVVITVQVSPSTVPHLSSSLSDSKRMTLHALFKASVATLCKHPLRS